jgi:hypothetical protein
MCTRVNCMHMHTFMIRVGTAVHDTMCRIRCVLPTSTDFAVQMLDFIESHQWPWASIEPLTLENVSEAVAQKCSHLQFQIWQQLWDIGATLQHDDHEQVRTSCDQSPQAARSAAPSRSELRLQLDGKALSSCEP